MNWLFKFLEINNDFVRVIYIVDGLPTDDFDGEFIYYFNTKKVNVIKKAKNDPFGKKAGYIAAHIRKYADLERKQHKDYYRIVFG